MAVGATLSASAFRSFRSILGDVSSSAENPFAVHLESGDG